jgi:PST family polysaccharide transporter
VKHDVKSARRITTNAGWLVGEKLYRGFLGIVVGALVARYLQPEGYGTLALGLAIVGVAAMVARFGMEQIVVLHVASGDWDRPSVLSQAWRISTILGVLCFLTVVAVASVFKDSNLRTVTLILGVGLIDQVGATYRLAFQALLETRRVIIAEVLLATVFSGVQLVLVFKKASLIEFAIVFLAAQLAASCATYILYRTKLLLDHDTALPAPGAKRLLNQSWPIFVSGLVGYLYTHLDRIMLGAMSGVQEVGVYAAASRIFEFAFFLPTALVHSLVPRLASEASENGIVSRNTFLTAGAALGILGILTTAGMAVGSWPTMQLLYGSSYAGSASVLAILSFSMLPLSVGRLRNASWVATGSQINVLYSNVCGLISNATLNYILIPLLGATGAAVATTASFLLAFWLAGYLLPATRAMARLQTEASLAAFSPDRLKQATSTMRNLIFRK